MNMKTILISSELHAKLLKHAKQEGMMLKSVVERAILAYLKAPRKEN